MSGGDGKPGTQLTIRLVPIDAWRWEARAGSLGSGECDTVIDALSDLIENLKRNRDEWLEDALARDEATTDEAS